jgi:hypothetical protein
MCSRICHICVSFHCYREASWFIFHSLVKRLLSLNTWTLDTAFFTNASRHTLQCSVGSSFIFARYLMCSNVTLLKITQAYTGCSKSLCAPDY